jgi:hypothetical protein
MEIHVVCFIFGAILLGVGLVGGGIAVKDISVPKVPWFSRLIAFALGAFLMVLGISLSPSILSSTNPPPLSSPSPSPSQSAPSPAQSVVPVTSPASEPTSTADDDTAYQNQVFMQIKEVARKAGFSGYTLIDSYGEKLQDNSSASLPLTLAQGIDYTILGVCDEDCGDIDLSLYDENRNLISSDNQQDSLPVVNATPQWSGDFYLEVGMQNCPAPYCYYGIGLFKK